jgi:outer membrane protein
MRQKLLYILPLMVLFYCLQANLFAQTTHTFSLGGALGHAMEHNYDLLSSLKDIEAAEKQVQEYMAIGYPQISGSINYTDYLSLPTFIMPANSFFPGSPEQEIQFGTKYNASADISASQLIFDGKYIVGVQASRQLLERNRQQFIKTKNDMIEAVSAAYFRALVTENLRDILDSTIVYMESMLNETRYTWEAGFAEETDVDQLELIVSDLRANLILTETQTGIAYAFLKFLCGIEADDEIVLTNRLDEIMAEVNYSALVDEPFHFENNIDYRLLQTQYKIAELQLKLQKSEYLPSLSAIINYQTQAQRNTWDFLNPEKKWYGSSFWGVEMAIPLWSSGIRSSRVQQARIDLDKLALADKKLRSGLTIEVKTARAEFHNAHLVMLNKSMAMNTAKKILRITSEKYRQGMAGSLDLLQANNQFLSNTSDYILAMQEVMVKKLSLEKLLYSEE